MRGKEVILQSISKVADEAWKVFILWPQVISQMSELTQILYYFLLAQVVSYLKISPSTLSTFTVLVQPGSGSWKARVLRP